jgi:hypothetical protein
VAGKCLLNNGALTTLDRKKIKDESEVWRQKLIGWDTERKKANTSKVDLAIQAGQNAKTAEEKAAALATLREVQDSLNHWMYLWRY